jgi:hypothetical protein
MIMAMATAMKLAMATACHCFLLSFFPISYHVQLLLLLLLGGRSFPPLPLRQVTFRDTRVLTHAVLISGIEHYVQFGDVTSLSLLDFYIKNPLAKYRNIKPPSSPSNTTPSSSKPPYAAPTSGLGSSSLDMSRARPSFNSPNTGTSVSE